MSRFRTLEIAGKFGISMIAVVVIQGILAYRFRVFSYFDLPLVGIVYYGFVYSNPIASIVIGGALGLMQDSLSTSLLGANGFSKTLVGFMAASAGSKFAVDQPLTRILGLFLFSLADGLLVTMLSAVSGPGSNATYSGALGGWLLAATFNTLLGLVLLGYHDRFGNASST